MVNTVGWTVTVDVMVLVAGVTVTARYEEQSATPCLVATADAMTARAGSWGQRLLIMLLNPSGLCIPLRQLFALQAASTTATRAGSSITAPWNLMMARVRDWNSEKKKQMRYW